jgi:hypothetical protein
MAKAVTYTVRAQLCVQLLQHHQLLSGELHGHAACRKQQLQHVQ